ncbi:hypothetical protein LWI28_024836 [Acer negundo]|uniref:Uncharacterized protein n=1 Tax=Acer negundo TaxID=4023 RepID=A0AAD5NM83_ACENE|nr:hypothetical protein LWI28_024836 [Acer negundo]
MNKVNAVLRNIQACSEGLISFNKKKRCKLHEVINTKRNELKVLSIVPVQRSWRADPSLTQISCGLKIYLEEDNGFFLNIINLVEDAVDPIKVLHLL